MIKIHALNHTYGDRTILDIPDLSFEDHTIHILARPNGAGKTTLLRLINKLESPSSGKVDPGTGRRDMVYCFQKPYLFRTTVRKNVEYGLAIRGIKDEKKTNRIMERLGLSDLAEQSAKTLSAGETHKTSLARALVIEPSLLLLDEPFAHLDTESVLAAEQAILDLQTGGTTVVIATHIPERMFSLSANITNLENGKIIPSEMLNVFDGIIRHEADTALLDLQDQVSIITATELSGSVRAVLHPYDVILSQNPVMSSMRNTFKSSVLEISDKHDIKEVKLDAGFTFYAHITPASLKEMNLSPGSEVYASFKATAVKVFAKPVYSTKGHCLNGNFAR